MKASQPLAVEMKSSILCMPWEPIKTVVTFAMWLAYSDTLSNLCFTPEHNHIKTLSHTYFKVNTQCIDIKLCGML